VGAAFSSALTGVAGSSFFDQPQPTAEMLRAAKVAAITLNDNF
jgi:hypothetical protein